MSISEDIMAGLLGILQARKGIQAHVVTNGNANQTIKLLNDYDRVFPAFTIVNNGSAQCKIGWGGNATFPLLAGTSMTFRWSNPAARQLCVNDGGTAATLDIMG